MRVGIRASFGRDVGFQDLTPDRPVGMLEVNLFRAPPVSEPIQDDLDHLDVHVVDPGDPPCVEATSAPRGTFIDPLSGP